MESHSNRKKVIVDTDMGWDDVLSILYLMKNPTIEIVGITVTGCGETNLRWGAIIAKTLMELGNQTQASVCIGTSMPLKYEHVFPQSFKDDMNDIMGLLGSLNPQADIDLDSRPAWEFISDILEQTKEDITILCIGGFTNIAKMLELYPSTPVDKITGIYAMAGAVYVDGNVASLNDAKPEWNQGPIYGTNYVAEWNVFVDPVAAKIVFDSSIPLTLIPLDACDYIILGPEYVDTITATDPIANLARNIFIKKTGSSSEGSPVPIFDPLATMVMADGLGPFQSSSEFMDVNIVDSETKNECGNTYVVKSGLRKVTIVEGVSQRAFAVHYAKVINGEVLNVYEE
ncbi:MAG: nucleoside hydrolase [Psychromonas sp.]